MILAVLVNFFAWVRHVGVVDVAGRLGGCSWADVRLSLGHRLGNDLRVGRVVEGYCVRLQVHDEVRGG